METVIINKRTNDTALSSVVYRVRLWERIRTLNSKMELSMEEHQEYYVLQCKLEELTKN
jgi:hypothetical protein